MLTDGTWTYTWQNGRELAAMTDGTTTWNYTYDANGMRTSRTNGTTTYNYVYNGSQLTQMTVGNDTLYFTYGLLGPTTVTWNGTTYYYSLSGQGDVTGIFNEDGNPVVTYTWDNAWGYNPIPEGVMASTLGELNPLRYRGYVYDTETGYYYLQSRYYDPKIGRFINADVFASTGQGLLGNNMFAYCNNNPVNLLDPAGTYCCAIFGDNQLLHLNLQVYFSSGGAGGGGCSAKIPTSKDKIDGLVYNQGTFEYSEESVGLGSYAENGCAVIATYNAMKLLGKGASLGAIRDEYSDNAELLMLGLWGVAPSSIGNYFKRHNINCTGYTSYADLRYNIAEGAVVVFTVQNNRDNPFSPYHTMAAQYTGGVFRVYNAFTDSTKYSDKPALDCIYPNSRWIYGYIVGG